MEGKTMVDETTKDEAHGRMLYSLEATDCYLTLNFIQVCRNYFRSHAWFDQSMLKYMYDTATGCYVHPQCPVINIVFPIKQVKTECGTISYHPCLVSVKSWDAIDSSDMESELSSMREYLEDYRSTNDNRSTSALCLLLVIGTSTGSSPKKQPAEQGQGSFPHEDTYISIVVPPSDRFAINKTIGNMAGASNISELVASHSFAFAETNENALRGAATKSYHELGQRLLEDKKQLWRNYYN
jgi:hypothetical protein